MRQVGSEKMETTQAFEGKDLLKSISKLLGYASGYADIAAGAYSGKSNSINMNYEIAKGAFVAASELSKRCPELVNKLVEAIPIAKPYIEKLTSENADDAMGMVSKLFKEFDKDQSSGSYRPLHEIAKKVGSEIFTEKALEMLLGR